jgi:FPC/CPF motif-containing protein YcgG
MRTKPIAAQAETAFRQFVLDADFPCLGAKAAFNSNMETVQVFDELGTAESTKALAGALFHFSRADHTPSEYATFIVIFEHPRQTNEVEFENLMWRQLRLLHELDTPRFDWAPGVASDPDDPHFSFSFAGQALYVIGMHANSSREARRFAWPTLVFNPHEQFERLRADGKWRRMQATIRERDRHVQGTINPMLSDFGVQSEARQYSGRAVEENWKAPFPKTAGKCPFAH